MINNILENVDEEEVKSGLEMFLEPHGLSLSNDIEPPIFLAYSVYEKDREVGQVGFSFYDKEEYTVFKPYVIIDWIFMDKTGTGVGTRLLSGGVKFARSMGAKSLIIDSISDSSDIELDEYDNICFFNLELRKNIFLKIGDKLNEDVKRSIYFEKESNYIIFELK